VTTWKAAAERGHLDALSDHSATSVTICSAPEEEELQQNQIKNKLFVAKDQYGNTAWHAAAQRGSVETLEKLWSWAKELKLNTS